MNKSLAENGLFPLIEQIKRYNTGLFVESSSIDDLKEEIRNLQTCLKETSEDLIKEKIAREQLQRIIESEIIEKLNSLQETWSVEPTRAADHPERVELRDDASENGECDSNGDSADQPLDQHAGEPKEGEDQRKESKDFNLFLIKQNELIDKLGQNIDRFVERNDESKLNDKQLQNFISSAIHKEIEHLLAKDGRELQESILKEAAGSKTPKESTKSKKPNNKRFLLSSSGNSRKEAATKEDQVRRLSLHDFSIQNHLNNVNQNSLPHHGGNQTNQTNQTIQTNQTNHTDEIVHEINQMISEETLTKNPKNSSLASRIRRFPFKFRKSKSLIQLNNANDVETTLSGDNRDEETANKSESSDERKLPETNGHESKADNDESKAKGDRTRDERASEKSKDADKINEKLSEKVSDEKMNSSNKATSDRPISRFRQFVLKKKDGSDQENKISLNKFSSKQQTIRADEQGDQNEKSDESKGKTENEDTSSNEKRPNEKVPANKHQTNGRSTTITTANVHSASSKEERPSDRESRILKSVLKKSSSMDSNLKLPKKQIAFSDERIEFSAEEIDSSDTGSTYSLSNVDSANSTNAFILSPTEQVVTIQKVIERPVPAPRFSQPKTLTSL